MTDFKSLEAKWQKRWEEKKVFSAEQGKKKFYVLEMFPYPSGSGLHMGHAFNYTIGDIYARFKRMNGFDVLYPMGYDSFGLPAENAAIKAGINPKDYTGNSIQNFIAQQKGLGLSYDWSRMIKTSDPEYYRWNQYFFIKFMEKGLVYRKKARVNWCPKCETVLANEQVHDGKCWRHKQTDVVDKELEQWFIRTTEYADELLAGLGSLDWPKRIKSMQENWIGKSHGVEIFFRLEDSDTVLPAFTTRCDTIHSVTFVVMAPEHPMAAELVKGTKYEKDFAKALKIIKKQSIIERTTPEGKDKIGCFLGKYAINPVSNEKIPIYIANFCLMDYGTGIVMADAHDQRDFEFARKYKIPLKFVISDDGAAIDANKAARAFLSDGILFNSGQFSGMNNKDALPLMADWIEKNKFGRKTVNFKLKDWLISRQRYWGTPIPIVYCAKCGIVPVPYEELPVRLPDEVKFGKGNPLETNEDFVQAKCPKCGGAARRETDTMDTFFDSSWYFLRYCDNKNTKIPFDKSKVKHWLPVDLYIGGAEHACMHLIYARFFMKALRDMGYIFFDEPFLRLFNQGMLHKEGVVMSKSKGNVVLPEDVSRNWGIDTARLFLVSIASPDKDTEWSEEGVNGSLRFINRLLNFIKDFKEAPMSAIDESRFNKLLMEYTDDLENLRYNLAVIKMKEMFGSIENGCGRDYLERFIKVLSPICPHIAEEFWENIGNKPFVSLQQWPEANKKKISEKAEAAQETVDKTMADVREVLKLIKIEKPKKITIIVAEKWKYDFVRKLKELLEETRNVGEIMKKLMAGDFRKYGNDIQKMVPKLVNDPSKLPVVVLSQELEYKSLAQSVELLKKEFGCQIDVIKAEDSKIQKQAMPGKAAILVE